MEKRFCRDGSFDFVFDSTKECKHKKGKRSQVGRLPKNCGIKGKKESKDCIQIFN